MSINVFTLSRIGKEIINNYKIYYIYIFILFMIFTLAILTILKYVLLSIESKGAHVTL